MDPETTGARPTSVRRTAPLLSALVLVALAGCGSGDTEVASDPAPTSTDTTTTPSASPSAEPSEGTYPPYAPTDYTYQLSVQCFCIGGGAPIEVTVEGDRVVGAVYAGGVTGHGSVTPGEPADKAFWLSIDDVIDVANDAVADGAAEVDVDWPEGQDHPDRVYVDHAEQTADDETGYEIADVRVTP